MHVIKNQSNILLYSNSRTDNLELGFNIELLIIVIIIVIIVVVVVIVNK